MQTTTSSSDRRRSPRPQQSQPRRSAAELVAQPPRGWAVSVLELSADTEARKRARMLVLKGEYGYRVLFFTTVKVLKRTSTAEGQVEVLDDLDLLPTNALECAVEAQLLTDEVLEHLIEEGCALALLQKEVPRVHERPLTQRPFEVLAGLDLAAVAAVETPKAPAPKEAPAPKKAPKVKPKVWNWWHALACTAPL